MGELISVPLSKLDDGPNVRGTIDDKLWRSIAAHGVLQPIVVCRTPVGRYQVLYGHRRVAGARRARLTRIPAILEAVAPPDLPVRQLVENLHRRGMNPMDVAKALRATLEADPALTQRELAKTIGRNPAWVSTRLALLNLDAETQLAVAEGRIGANRGYAVSKLTTPARPTGRPRLLASDEADATEGRSRSVAVELPGAAGRHPAKATVGVDLADRVVDLVLDDGYGRSVMLSLRPAAAKLLGLRLTQASAATLAVPA